MIRPLLLGLLLLPAAQPFQDPTSTPGPLRARYLKTVADDFVVEAYHNGARVADDRRHLLVEVFGAQAERVDVEARVDLDQVRGRVNGPRRAAAGC